MITALHFWTDDGGASWRFALFQARPGAGRDNTELYRSYRRCNLKTAIRDAEILTAACDKHGDKPKKSVTGY